MDELNKFRAEITPEMLGAGHMVLSDAVPTEEMWDVDELVKDCWVAMRHAVVHEDPMLEK